MQMEIICRFFQILQKTLKLELDIGEYGNDLLSKLLIINPLDRITINDAIDHKWFK